MTPAPNISWRLGLALALLSGVLLRFVVGLQPIAWLAWIAPLPLLWLALRSAARNARLLILLAALIACSANFAYYRLVMPWPLAILIVFLQALLWLFVIAETRRVVLRGRSAWTVLAYPVFWVAVDTLMAAFLPDGNWASLAYSQSEVLPILQVVALTGISGLFFLLALVPSTLAVAAHGRARLPGTVAAVLGTAILLGAATSYGLARLREPVAGNTSHFGLAAIDDAIGLKAAPPYIQSIQSRYADQIAWLAHSGAKIVLLPEKIAVVSASNAANWQSYFSSQAIANKVWLVAGMTVQQTGGLANYAWAYAPNGQLEQTYQKHFLAPPERGYLPGSDYNTQVIDGIRYGLAICKDMHFASLGREYGRRRANVMLVPAWDFGLDAWMGARMTTVRGVENGYMVVRSSREGRLSISDALGRVLVEADSAALPGNALEASVIVTPQLTTWFTRFGNVLGWLCVALAVLMMGFSRRA